MEDNRKTGLNGQGKKGSDLSQQLDRLFSSLNMSRKKDGIDKVKSDTEHLIFEDNRLEESLTEKLMKDMNKGSVHMSTDSSDSIDSNFGLGLDLENNLSSPMDSGAENSLETSVDDLSSNVLYKDLNIDNPMPENMTIKNPELDASILSNKVGEGINYDTMNGNLDINELNTNGEYLKEEKMAANAFENPNYSMTMSEDLNFANSGINYENPQHDDIILDDTMLESLNIDKSILEESNYEKSIFDNSIIDDKRSDDMDIDNSIFSDKVMHDHRVSVDGVNTPLFEQSNPIPADSAEDILFEQKPETTSNVEAHSVNPEYLAPEVGEEKKDSFVNNNILNDEDLFQSETVNHGQDLYQSNSVNEIDEKISKLGMSNYVSESENGLESEPKMNMENQMLGNQEMEATFVESNYDDSINSQTVPHVERKIAKTNGLIDYDTIINENQVMDIESIYDFNNLLKQMGETIFMVELYSRTLPENLPRSAKRSTVLNILKTSSIDVQSLLKDARDRIDSLQSVSGELVEKIDELDKSNLAEIEELEKKIHEYRLKIQSRDQYKKSQNKVIATEIQRIMNIVDFIQG